MHTIKRDIIDLSTLSLMYQALLISLPHRAIRRYGTMSPDTQTQPFQKSTMQTGSENYAYMHICTEVLCTVQKIDTKYLPISARLQQNMTKIVKFNHLSFKWV